MVTRRALLHLAWRCVSARMFNSCDSLLLRPCPPCGCASTDDVRRVEAVRRAPHKASLVRGGSLFLLMLAFFPTCQIPQFSYRDDIVQSTEAGIPRARGGTQVSVVGALLTEAADSPRHGDTSNDQLEKLTEEVCVVGEIDYAPFILSAVDLSTVPSTPKGNSPPIYGGIAGAIQRSRWGLSHQISAMGSSLMYHFLSLEPPEPTKTSPREESLLRAATGGGPKRRLAVWSPKYAGNDGDDDDDGDDDFDGNGNVYDGYQPTLADTPGSSSGDTQEEASTPRRPLPPDWPLPLNDAVFVYLPFVAGYLTLMALGAFVVVLGIPLLILLLCAPRSLWKSTGGFVNLFCFSAPPCSAEACSIEPLTESRQDQTASESHPAQEDQRAHGGVGSEMKVGKGLSVLSEEAMTQTGIEPKTTLEKGSLGEEQGSGENEAAGHAAEEGAPLHKNETQLYTWTGQNLGLGLLVTLLIAVLVCVSLGFGHTAHLSQTLHAVHCAATAAIAQVFDGTEPGRQDVVAVLEQWPAKTLPEPEGPKDEDDYPPASPEYGAVLRSLLKAGALPEDKLELLTRRYDGTGIRTREGMGTVDRGRDADLRALHFRRLAGLWDTDDEDEDEEDSRNSSVLDLPSLSPARFATNVISFKEDEDEDEQSQLSDTTEKRPPIEIVPLFGQDDQLLVPKQSVIGSSFGGIRPLLKIVRRFQNLADSEASGSFSSVSATIFGKGLTAEHLLLSFYDHVSTIEMMLEANIYPPRGGGLFGHFSLARITALPFLRALKAQVPESIDALYTAEDEVRKVLDDVLEQQRSAEKILRGADDAKDKVEDIADKVASIVKALIQPRRVLLPTILYLWGSVLAFLLVGAILYLMYLNRQPAKVWESGDISPRPAGCLWWFTFVVAGGTILLGAALLTTAVVSMDACIYAANTLQEPEALQQLMRNKPLDAALANKVDHIISACVGRTDARDISGVLPIEDLRANLRTTIDKVKREVEDRRADQTVEDVLYVAPRVLNLAYEHAGLFLFRGDVRAHSERVSPVVYFSGIQDETVTFYAFFALDRAEFLGPPGTRKSNLLRLPSPAPTDDDLKTIIINQNQHPLAVDLDVVLEETRPATERLRALRRIFAAQEYWGRYRLYGVREVENAIAPFYFQVYMADNRGTAEREKYMMVDDNSTQARQRTQTFLLTLSPEDRESLGASLELARRKTSVRPSQAFTCVNRVRHSAKQRRRADQKTIRRKIQAYRTGITDFSSRNRDAGIRMVDEGRRRVPCSYEEYRKQIQNEAEEAMFALASLYGRAEKLLNEVESMILVRAEALGDYLDVVARTLDCSPVYRGVVTTQHLICRDATEQIALLGIVWLVISLLSFVLFFAVFCIWRYLSTRDFKRREAERQRLEALRAAEQAAEDARRAEEERVAAEEAAAARAAATAARAEARARQVSAAALNRQRTSLARAQSLSTAPLQIQSRSMGTLGSVRDMLTAHDQGESVEDTMWADTTLD